MRQILFIALIGAFFLFPVLQVNAAFYPFGGPITSILPPIPFGPCPLPAIVVGPPNPGTFMMPPGILFPFFKLTIGTFVLGLSAAPFCGPIYFMGTSL